MADSNPQSPADIQSMIDAAMAEAQSASASEDASAPEPAQEPVAAVGKAWSAGDGIELLSDVDLHVTIELGRTEMRVEDVLRLSEGSVIELDKLAGDPVDVYVNNRLVARGEVLVLNDNFCIRISEIMADLQVQEEGVAEPVGADASGQ